MSKKDISCQKIPSWDMIPKRDGSYKETYKCTSSGGTNYIKTQGRNVFLDTPLYETTMPITAQALLLGGSLGGGFGGGFGETFGTVMPDIGGFSNMLPFMAAMDKKNNNDMFSNMMTASLFLGGGHRREQSNQTSSTQTIPPELLSAHLNTSMNQQPTHSTPKANLLPMPEW